MVKTEITGTDAQNLLEDAGVLPKLFRLWRANEPLQLVGLGQFEGEEAYIIEFDHAADAPQLRFYLSPESYRTIRHEVRTPESTVLTRLLAYQEKAGVYLPTHSEIIAPGTGRSVVRIESIQIGVGIYDEYFSQGP
mgnify:CR=1 FL=1